MSIPVPVGDLRAVLAERGNAAYLLTVSDDGRPHAVHVALAWEGDRLAADVGRRSAANAAARPAVSLLSPAPVAGDYSLIVDGTAAVAGARVLVAPAHAVLHRPAVTPATSTCDADCRPVRT